MQINEMFETKHKIKFSSTNKNVRNIQFTNK